MSIVSEGRPIESTAVWNAADVADSGDWSVTLDATQRAELVGAAHQAVAVGYSPLEVPQSAFDLPSLHDAVARWSRALVSGRGFVLIRGFPLEQLTSNEVEVAYVGLGRQLGTPVGQNASGDLLGHVRDEGVPRRDPTVRLYQTRERQDFHTDGSDIVGLLCLRPARQAARAASPVPPPSTTRSWLGAPTSSKCFTSPCTGIATARSRPGGSVLCPPGPQRRRRHATHVLHRLVHP